MPLRRQAHPRPGVLRRRSCRCGATAVEAAIVLPLLSLLMLACVDIGRAVHAQIVVTNAVRVGAEYGATHRFTSDTRANWEARVRSTMEQEIVSMQHAAPEAFAATVTTSEVSANELRIEVSATYPFRMIVSWPGLANTLELAHSVTMRQYQ